MNNTGKNLINLFKNILEYKQEKTHPRYTVFQENLYIKDKYNIIPDQKKVYSSNILTNRKSFDFYSVDINKYKKNFIEKYLFN